MGRGGIGFDPSMLGIALGAVLVVAGVLTVALVWERWSTRRQRRRRRAESEAQRLVRRHGGEAAAVLERAIVRARRGRRRRHLELAARLMR